MTALYMFRLLILTFHGKPVNESVFSGIKESPKVMTIPLVILAALSLFVFYSFNPIGAASGWFYAAIERPLSVVPEMMQPATAHVFHEAVEHIHGVAMLISVLMAGAGVLLAFAMYQWKKVNPDKIAQRAGVLYSGASNKWYFDELYNKAFVGGTIVLTKILRWFDETIVDGFVNGSAYVTKIISSMSGWVDNNVVDGLVNATASTADKAGGLLTKVQTGKVQVYLVYVVFSFLVLFILFF
jgi:NADH-quinone oxidoreductase subunit L